MVPGQSPFSLHYVTTYVHPYVTEKFFNSKYPKEEVKTITEVKSIYVQNALRLITNLLNLEVILLNISCLVVLAL